MQEYNKLSLQPYKLVPFTAQDSEGNSIYHTNVLMAVLSDHVVICLDSIKDDVERERVV